MSALSEPELVKNTLSMPSGVISASRAAAWKAIGWPIWKVGAKSIVAACVWIASTISRRPCPALQHHSPAVPSSTSRLSLV